MVKIKRVLGIIVILALLVGSGAPFLASIAPAVAQDTETSQLAPLNPDFLDFLQQPSEPFYGYVPPTMDLSHLKETPVQTKQTLQALPATFNWGTQGKVTPVKNQNPCGTCWTFGTLAAVESRVWIVGDVEYDFSEQNIACCTDPAWVYLIGNRCMGGGNSLKAMDVLAKKGTRLESCDPYNIGTINTDTCNDACTTIKRVTDYRRVASDAGQITEIKTAVYDYGPVSMAYCHEPELFDEVTNIYYWPDCTEYTNHLVCIVGWDDTVGWPGGAGNGAWIVKNSWGSSFGDNGYFYLCYGSANMEEVASYQYKDYDANEIVYYWDEAGLVGAGGYGNTSAWMASVFTSGQDGVLTHVDFWTTSNNATYELYVYDGSFGSQLAYQTGSCDEFGYYSIPLTTPVSVTNGQQFTVAVKMTTPGFDYPLPVEIVLLGMCEPPIQTEVCFTRHLDGDPWDDAAGFAGVGVNVCLRAKITTPLEPPTVTTNDATNIGINSATLNGNLDDLGTASAVDVSFEWGEASGEPYLNETNPETMDAVGPFTFDLGGLSPNTTYYFRAKAVGDGISYGLENSFATQAEAGASATRTLPASVDPGADFDVGIEASGCGSFSFGQVVETLPNGFSYVSCASTEVSVATTDNSIKFTFIGDSVTLTYTVKASTTEGVYTFSGVVKDEYMVEYPIGGDENITVGFDPMNYDADGDGEISKVEATAAVVDYFDGTITKEQALAVITLYFASRSGSGNSSAIRGCQWRW